MAIDVPQLAEVVVGGTPQPWAALGFKIEGDRVAFTNGAVRASGGLAGVHTLVVDGIDGALTVDGIAVEPGRTGEAVEHPNGAFELDHVVIATDSLERTSGAVEAALGLPRRRIREVGEGESRVRQAFHRFPRTRRGAAGCIIEIVESARTKDAEPSLFGVVVNVTALDSLCARLGPDLIGQPKPAVQPGRLIATVRERAGIGFPLALMSPAVA